MRVCLIYVGIGVAGFKAFRSPDDREGGWISHGLASIAANLKRHGHEPELIDMRHLSGWEAFKDKIIFDKYSVYCLSISPVDYRHGLRAAETIRDLQPEAKIIVGGIHPSIFPEKYDNTYIDTVVMGEGETTLPELLKDLDNLPNLVKGEKPDLNQIPWVEREMFQYWRELACNFAPGQELPSVTMLAGRGCPYKCSYCQPAENAVFGKPFRMRDVDNVLEELGWLYQRYHFKSITFWDDTFTFNRKWIEEFCGKYNYSAKIAACSRADIICHNADMIKELAKIGVDWLVIGLESGSQRMLDLINKGTTVEQNREALEICRRHGIRVFATVMFGLPTESREEMEQTVRMIEAARPDFVSPFWYVPIPGTKLYNFCCDNELLLQDMDQTTIERTNKFVPYLKGIDYTYLSEVVKEKMGIL